jgi:hypothetical protein
MRPATLAAAAIAAITIGRHAQAQVIGNNAPNRTVSTQAGTASNPYSRASQCPAHTDVVFWPTVQRVPDFPKGILVCVVENQAVKKTGR